MNILYHHRTRMQGGEGAHICGIVNAFKQMGHRISLVSPYGVSSEEPGVSNTRHSSSHRLYNLINRKLPQIGFESMAMGYNIPAYCRMYNIARHEQVDLIYERYALYNVSGVWLSRKLGIPIVLEVNIVSDLDDIRPIKMRKIAEQLENLMLNQATAIVTISSFLKHHLVSRGVAERKIWVIPNAVDPGKFRSGNGAVIRREYNIEDSLVIGFVGNLSAWWYSLDALIHIFAEIVASCGDRAHLLLVGREFLKPRLGELIQKHNISDYVTMTGWIEHERIPDYIDAMDVALLPNSNLWGSPIKMFEYMAMGKPVVAPAYGPIEEIITSGENGILFEPGRYSDLKQAVLTLVNNPDLCGRIGENARSTVMSKHTWIKNAEKILDIYGSIKGR